MTGIHPYCLTAPVASRALQNLLESDGRGTYRDTHPWLVAREMFLDAQAAGERIAVMFAVSEHLRFSHWAFVETLNVIELHRATWETALGFTVLKPVNPIWEPLDSLLLRPTLEQLRREQIEGIHQHRYALSNGELHPYAICETPAFILASS